MTKTKPHRLLIIDAKGMNRSADNFLKRRGTYFESPLTRYHRMKREAREQSNLKVRRGG